MIPNVEPVSDRVVLRLQCGAVTVYFHVAANCDYRRRRRSFVVVPMYSDKPGLGKRHTKTEMGKISELSEELLVKIISFLPTKEAVSTSILSKQWEFLWMWLPKLDYDMDDFESELVSREYMNKNLPLHRAPVLERFSLDLGSASVQPDDVKVWAGIAVSRCVRELCIISYHSEPSVCLPTSLYTCEPLVSLILNGQTVFVDVPPMVSLPSLKTLELRGVTYSNEDSLRLLLPHCPVLEDLVIERYEGGDDNLRGLVVTSPLLQRLSLYVPSGSSPDGYVIVTPFLKYFKFEAERSDFSYLIEHMPKLEEVVISVDDDIEMLLESITSVRRLSLSSYFDSSLYSAGIVFNQLEYLKLCIDDCDWPQILFRFLEDSPKLRDLHIYAESDRSYHEPFSLNNISVPKCLLESLESFKFEGYRGTSEERDVLSFFFKNACRLKSSSISK